MRQIICLSFIFFSSLTASMLTLPMPTCEEEALFVRRVLELWKDEDYGILEGQLKNYLTIRPHTPFRDFFLLLIGDTALKNKNFADAIAYYSNIKDPALKEEALAKRWQVFYQMGEYVQLYRETSASPFPLTDEGVFFFAEAAFREALSLLKISGHEEQVISLFSEAIPAYETLLTKPVYASHAKLALAEIHRHLNRPQQAARLYMELAEEEENPEILFHAAGLLLQCDKEKAEHLFKSLASGPASRASEAAYQWLLLLAEREEWDTIEQEREVFTSKLSFERLPTCYFYLGMHNFKKKKYDQATSDLEKCIDSSLPRLYEKKAFMTLLLAACELQRWEVCEKAYQKIYMRFPEIAAEASFILGSAYQKGGQGSFALQLFERVIYGFPGSDFAEKSAWEKIRLLISEKKLAAAHSMILEYLTTYQDTFRRSDILKLAVDVSLAQLSETNVFDQLAADLERGLQERVYSQQEKREKEHLLAKTYLKLGKKQLALELLLAIEDPDPLILTHCYLEEDVDYEKIIIYGEKALQLYPKEHSLHLHLFNAYLALSKETKEKDFTQKAAEHLESSIKFFPISMENRLWLARYYAKEDPMRAIPLLESILENPTSFKKFDNEGILLATLYQMYYRLEDAETLLNRIVALQQKTALEAELRLAEIFIEKGEPTRADSLFEKLEQSAIPLIACNACLQRARLDFPSEPEKNLKKLHDLAARKSLVYEPVHLEAALEYAERKASLLPKNEQAECLLSLLEEVKASFTQQDDILSKDYHAARAYHPEKDLIYQAYMRYIDARIFILQAQLAKDPLEGKTKTNAARALFSTLRQGKYAVTRYLKERAISFYEEN
jgi:hypothetical protein